MLSRRFYYTNLTFSSVLLAFLLLRLAPLKVAANLIAVRPSIAHYFYEKFKAELTPDEVQRYSTIFTNPNISKAQAQKKLETLVQAKGADFQKRYAEWKAQQDKHNIEWWQVNDCRMAKTSSTAQKLYETIKDVSFNQTLSFAEDCAAYNQLLERATSAVRGELSWTRMNCSDPLPPLNPHGRLDFKLIL
ncbi:hypothetical protein M3Y99_01953800 [Aphelenchoides fujianensis]|nr:hypothetical protein M3Y99_01953800 [Aphelenchoides fujianensis]